MSKRDLTPLEARVLAVLVEKESTVPDSYPLSANALTAGCNQKTARDPVMDVSEAEVLATVEELKSLSLVNTVSGSRVLRYEHNFARGLGVPGAAMALLTQLMLRGPQTAAELRQNTERLHRFADVSSVEGFLDELAAREQPFAIKLAKAPGAREARWAHLLCGPVSSAEQAASVAAPRDEEVALQRVELAALKAEVASLRSLVDRMAAELGITP
ncbi:YceH family protein [Roseateles sp.]|uniref:YceH family protein n=1 Tax=Roseateles sp. TaxID=1971397 RepID=UPI0025DF20CD|nr:YceH family protein [Roseateles sp.]MBV8036855.1 YceH family protein [Roseateles sp.]